MQGLPLARWLAWVLHLADAVAHAHRNLLVHRDLKPGNVQLDDHGRVKLLDFGIAKALDPLEDQRADTTVGGQRPYTPQFASPEQVRGEPVNTATDIYSLGVLLSLMLTGVCPMGRHARTAAEAEAARSVLDETPARPSRLSAAEALDPQWPQLPRRLAGFPISARTSSAAYVLGRLFWRHRAATAAGALGLGSLVVGLAVALAQMGASAQALQLADGARDLDSLVAKRPRISTVGAAAAKPFSSPRAPGWAWQTPADAPAVPARFAALAARDRPLAQMPTAAAQ